MLDPNNHYGLPLVYDTVTVVTAGGERITGVARNEDTFSVQLLTTDQSLRFFLKKDVKEVIHERKSLMPPYSGRRAERVAASGSDCLSRDFAGSTDIRVEGRLMKNNLSCWRCC